MASYWGNQNCPWLTCLGVKSTQILKVTGLYKISMTIYEKEMW